MSFTDLFVGFLGTAVGILVGYFVIPGRKYSAKEVLQRMEKLKKESESESVETVKSARERASTRKALFESEQKEFSQQLEKLEKMIDTKIATHQKREMKIAELKRVLMEEEHSVEAVKSNTHNVKKQIADNLIRMIGIPAERVKEELINQYENTFKDDAEIRLKNSVVWAQECSVREGKNILEGAIYRYGASTSVEHDRGEMIVQRDEIKGRIIGRGGRNIAFFEELFSVDVIFNDEPNTIIISSFNLVLREVARAALIRLMRERIISEETITRVKPLAEQDVDKILIREGEKTVKQLGLTKLSPEFIKLIGRLKFRTSYGQNILAHCFEVSNFSKLIAGEIGADVHIAAVAGFFHDIGKAIDQEVTGSHDVLTKELLEKYGFDPAIVHAAWTHHNAAPQETVEAKIVQAADAISAGRPGARAESLERYLAKIKDLEETALSFGGVKKAFTINAGREVRVVVEPEKVNDVGVGQLANDIAAKVQEKGGYPGKVKVTTIRLTKVTDYAK